ncbi:MAG: rhodanese-like domain-containing protein [Legionellales bacterium]|nr:rhodanese-like domain-containing protein [Legionellales bacterium]
MNVEIVTPQELKKLRDEKADFVLLDVREPDEFAICNLGGALIPLGTLPQKLNELDKNKHYVVHCKLGGRSQRAAEMMAAAGFTHVANLQGGIMGWINEIDKTMPKY